MNNLPMPLLSEGFAMPEMKSPWKWDITPISSSFVSGNWPAPLPFTEPEAKPLTLADHVQRFCNEVVTAVRSVVQAIADFFNSPQVRRFFKHFAAAARRAGIIQADAMPVRRRAVSTKRARLYQRKHLCIAKS